MIEYLSSYINKIINVTLLQSGITEAVVGCVGSWMLNSTGTLPELVWI